jgi:hypothetical protein
LTFRVALIKVKGILNVILENIICLSYFPINKVRIWQTLICSQENYFPFVTSLHFKLNSDSRFDTFRTIFQKLIQQSYRFKSKNGFNSSTKQFKV